MTSGPAGGIRFSIVIPVYNYAGVVARAVASACRQSGDDYEVLAIDDGSTDHSAQILEQCAAEHGGVFRYLRQPNRGVSAVRNLGVRSTAGEYLIFVDADDELDADALAGLRSTLERYSGPVALLVGGRTVMDIRGKARIHPAPRLPAVPEQRFKAYLRKQFALSNGAVAMHRSLFDRLHYDEQTRHAEDIPVFAHALLAEPVARVEQNLAIIHKHPDSRRHDVAAAVQTEYRIVDNIFDPAIVPATLMPFRREYIALRNLSLSRTCQAAGRYRDGLRYYRSALAAKPALAIRPRYLRRVLRCAWGAARDAVRAARDS